MDIGAGGLAGFWCWLSVILRGSDMLVVGDVFNDLEDVDYDEAFVYKFGLEVAIEAKF